MIFNKLILNNFKSYEYAEINFNKGITVIVGENGAGKSSIFEAISFALFKQHTAKRIEDLVRKGSNEPMSVELEFTSNNVDYQIIRERKKSSLTSKILRKKSDQFVPLCVGDKEVNAQIKDILDIDSNLFLNAIYVRQGEIADLINKTSAEKKFLIGKLLGLDSLEKAWKNMLPIINDFENKRSEIKGKISVTSNLEEEYNSKNDFLNELKDQGIEYEKQIKEFKKILDKHNIEKIDMEREKEIFDNNSNNLQIEKEEKKILEESKKNLNNQLDKIGEYESELNRLKKYVEKLPLFIDFEKSLSNIQQLKKDENLYKKNLDNIIVQKNIINKEKISSSKYLALIDENKLNIENKNEIEKKLMVFNQLEKDKNNLIQKIEINKNEIEEFFITMKNKLIKEGLDEVILNNIDEISKFESLILDYINKIKNDINLIDENLISNKENKVAYQESNKAVEKPLNELNDMGNQCPLCKSSITQMQKNDLIISYKNTIELNNEKIDLIENNIKDLLESKELLNKQIKRFDELLLKVKNHDNKLIRLKEDTEKLIEIDNKLETKKVNSFELGEYVLKIADNEKEIEKLKINHENFIAAKAALDVLDDENDIEYKLNVIETQLKEEFNKIDEIINKDSFLTKDIDEESLSNRISDLKKKEEEYNQIKGFIQNKEDLKSQIKLKIDNINLKHDKINNLEISIRESRYDEEKYNNLISKYDEIKKEYDDISNKLSGIKGQSIELIPIVNDLKKQLDLNSKFNKQYTIMGEYIDLLNNIREIYSKNGIQKDLRNQSKPLIQKYSKQYFNDFNFDYSDLILDEDYNVWVTGPEGKTSLDMVSGGEKIAIALSLRLGITQAMRNGDLDTILLDEPTIFLDTTRRNELINLIKEINSLPQMIIVTHEEQLENAADNLIKVSKDNGISKVTHSQ